MLPLFCFSSKRMIIVANPETETEVTDTQESQGPTPGTLQHAVSHRKAGRKVEGIGHLGRDQKRKNKPDRFMPIIIETNTWSDNRLSMCCGPHTVEATATEGSPCVPRLRSLSRHLSQLLSQAYLGYQSHRVFTCGLPPQSTRGWELMAPI